MSCQRILLAALSGHHVQASFHLQLDPVPRLVSQARRFVVQHAPDLPPETQDILVLLTSELVTNAVLHARTPIDLGITIADDAVFVSVHDLDLARPEQDPYGHREGGWGLGLVSALASQSSMDTHPGGGKTAWFRLPRTGAAHVPDSAAARVEVPGEGGSAR